MAIRESIDPAKPHAPWSGTLPFRQYREPFYPEFFEKAAAALGLTGTESLIDLGCGTGRVAFGFASYVKTLVGVDAEMPMLERAGREAKRLGLPIELIHSDTESFKHDGPMFDIATLGNIHWWLDRKQTHHVLDSILSEHGKVFICTALPLYDGDTTRWLTEFLAVRKKWSNFDYTPTAMQPEAFMQDSGFEIETKLVHAVVAEKPIEDIVKRALGYHPTSPDVLRDKLTLFTEALRKKLQPFADSDGCLIDKCYNAGVVLRRK
jgi:SAM-dependent methyltransferase